MLVKRFILGAFLLLFLAGAAYSYDLEYVIDGDTFIASDSTGEIRVRLWGVDAPEMSQPFGPEARARLASLLSDGFRITPVAIDQYDRVVAIVHASIDSDVQTQLLLSGHAWHSKRFAPRAWVYAEAEASARSKLLGLWSQPAPVAPWDWR